ncbi:MAG: zinc ribbon domain-containing protein [Acidobacteria bacterium]|nr:zinc ribbon domain-containing protein [Acidobacteriota bacterium]
MPLYEYECDRTGKRFEVIEKFSDAPLTKCEGRDGNPGCEGTVRRLLSAPAIQFKGSGWYVTDYAGKSGDSKSKDSDSGSKAKSEKSETKEAPKESKSSESKSGDA